MTESRWRLQDPGRRDTTECTAVEREVPGSRVSSIMAAMVPARLGTAFSAHDCARVQSTVRSQKHIIRIGTGQRQGWGKRPTAKGCQGSSELEQLFRNLMVEWITCLYTLIKTYQTPCTKKMNSAVYKLHLSKADLKKTNGR